MYCPILVLNLMDYTREQKSTSESSDLSGLLFTPYDAVRNAEFLECNICPHDDPDYANNLKIVPCVIDELS